MATRVAAGRRPRTLSIDVGGSGIKLLVLDATGKPVTDRVRVATPYPCTPDRLVTELATLAEPLAPYERVSVGFPGVVRNGRILTAPNLSRRSGPSSKVDPKIRAAWQGFRLADALTKVLGVPTRVENDADMQGGDVVSGKGVEVVLTLGTGLGSTVYADGRLALHLEIAHLPFGNGETFEDQVGEVTREKLGNRRWTRRVVHVVKAVDHLITPDHIFIGGGNSKRLTADFNDVPELRGRVTIVDNTAGLLGGIKLWKR